MRRVVLLIVMFFSSVALGENSSVVSLADENLEFKYQENNQPWEIATCEHQRHPTLPYDLNVTCDFGGIKKVYLVHLLVNYYPKTNYGHSAHEILYWVTDRSIQKRSYDSTTLWLHSTKDEAPAKFITLALGVENDMASLRLSVDLRKTPSSPAK